MVGVTEGYIPPTEVQAALANAGVHDVDTVEMWSSIIHEIDDVIMARRRERDSRKAASDDE